MSNISRPSRRKIVAGRYSLTIDKKPKQNPLNDDGGALQSLSDHLFF
ncbi:MAG: hypothetical protein AAB688_02490 [Patescibacteria group bacterium]